MEFFSLSTKRARFVVVATLISLSYLTERAFQGDVASITELFLYITLAESWNLIGGFAGYASFGQVVFFGVGGYVVGFMMVQFGLPLWYTLIIGGIVAALYGALLGMPLLRLHGPYFAIATLAAAEATHSLADLWVGLAPGGGVLTITTVGLHQPTNYLGTTGFAITFGILAGFSLMLVAFVSRSRFGYSLRLIRENEALSGALAVNATRIKVLAFSLSGMIAGIAGGVEAFREITLDPSKLFNPQLTILMVAMVILGGAGTIIGPLFGALIITAITTFISSVAPSAHDVVVPVAIVLGVMISPKGILSPLSSMRLPSFMAGHMRPEGSIELPNRS